MTRVSIVPMLCVGMLPGVLSRPGVETLERLGGVSTLERGDEG
jgi:hypothetical protein